MFVDIDNFKAVNDQLGHHTGDTLLINIANSLTELAPSKSQVGRIGGDEFVVLSSYSNQEEISQLCDRLLSSIIPVINQDLNKVTIGMSIGVCLFDKGKQQFNEVYQKADHAMYEIKKMAKMALPISRYNKSLVF